jgi:1,4-dihydroxy-2-naphthoate octaprenyltransferase
MILTAVMILALHVHWGILLFVGWGIISAVGYSLPPIRLSYRGGGEFVVLVTYSVALVWAGYFVQAGPVYSSLVCVLSVPIGFAVFSLITITQLLDLDADRKASKRSLVILLGVKPTLRIASLAVLLSMLSVVFFLLTGMLPVLAGLISIHSLPHGYRFFRTVFRRDEDSMTRYTKLAQGTLGLTLWYGLAPALGLMLDHWLGKSG